MSEFYQSPGFFQFHILAGGVRKKFFHNLSAKQTELSKVWLAGVNLAVKSTFLIASRLFIQHFTTILMSSFVDLIRF